MYKRMLLLIALMLTGAFSAFSQSIIINEVMASNSQTIADEDGDYADWIELHNTGATSVNLEGFGLSDDYENPFRWVFPQVEIAPGGFLLVWASGKNRTQPSSPLHTNFSISASGEEILLSHPDGALIDELIPTPIPTDMSTGRKPGAGNQWFFFDDPTPGAANTTHAWNGLAPEPVFSHPSGFYANPFDLQVSTTLDGAQIYYTLDGSEPTTSSALYTSALTIDSRQGTPNDISMIPTNFTDPGPPYFEGWQTPNGEVFKVNVIRASVVKENYLPRQPSTYYFMVDPLAENRYSLPVFFLATHRDNFFNPEIGIYIPGNHNNMFQRGPEWERPIHLAFFEADGSFAFQADMGVRLHGGTTRSRPRKSLRLYARGEYGTSWIEYPLFPEKNIGQYKRFLLRNSGNDWDQSIFRDGFMQYISRNLNVGSQYYRPAVVFLNGEYWGIHNLRDRYDHHYIYSHFGLQEHEFTAMENNSVFAYGDPGGTGHYNSMRSFINGNSMTNASNYAYVNTQMDVESFIDAQIANIYSMNTDWPGNNLNYWRRNITFNPDAPAGLDGRWRWNLLDMDFGFGLDFFYVPGVNQGASHNTLAMAMDPNGPGWPNPPWSTFLLRRLSTNENFRNDFINRFADLLNTSFSANRITHVIDSLEAVLLPEMTEHIDRWRRPTSITHWQQQVQRMRTFGQQRPAFMRQHIRNQFNLAGTYTLQLSVNDTQMGSVALNTIEPNLTDIWSGVYFRGVPVKLVAKPKHGYVFSHWSGSHSGTQGDIQLNFTADASLTAHFMVNPDFPGDELNPAAYKLMKGPYTFGYWNENEPEGNFPEHMLFLQSSKSDPLLEDVMTHRYHIPEGEYHADDLGSVGFPYRLTGRSRINGLGDQGISFINTGRSRDLGAAVLALDTRGVYGVQVSWTGGTVIPNARVYAIRLQYKVGPQGTWKDVTDPQGTVQEYMRSQQEGHEMQFGPLTLPEETSNQEYVQLRWKYYYTGTQLDVGHGRRDMLRLDNIVVSALNTSTNHEEAKPTGTRLLQNYPNPASGSTHISFYLPQPGQVQIVLCDLMGRKIKYLAQGYFTEGMHTELINIADVPPGVYFYRLETEQQFLMEKMIVQ
ncbi:MAG: CotH kinase family protein [Bacteroidales bacterium]